jgi:hypothetical protein
MLYDAARLPSFGLQCKITLLKIGKFCTLHTRVPDQPIAYLTKLSISQVERRKSINV